MREREREREATWSNQVVLYNTYIRNGMELFIAHNPCKSGNTHMRCLAQVISWLDYSKEKGIYFYCD